MRIKPILFNTEMVRAILDGRKTVTRRAVKPRYKEDEGGFQINRDVKTGEWWVEKSDWDEGSFDPPRYVNPPYRPGDVLWVRETWTSLVGSYLYRADQKPGMKNPGKWCPSIHMPREAARIFLRVTDVRVERLQEVCNIDLESEGIDVCLPLHLQKKQFGALWDSTIKHADLEKYGWAANPFCWVIEFERCEMPEET